MSPSWRSRSRSLVAASSFSWLAIFRLTRSRALVTNLIRSWPFCLTRSWRSRCSKKASSRGEKAGHFSTWAASSYWPAGRKVKSRGRPSMEIMVGVKRPALTVSLSCSSWSSSLFRPSGPRRFSRTSAAPPARWASSRQISGDSPPKVSSSQRSAWASSGAAASSSSSRARSAVRGSSLSTPGGRR